MKTLLHQLTAVLLAACMPCCSGVQWVSDHSSQLEQTGVVLLKDAAIDAFNIAGSALVKQATSGFTADFGNSLASGAFQNLPTMASSDRFNEIANIWSPNSPVVNAQLTQVVQKAAAAASATAQQNPSDVKRIVTAVAVAAQAAVNGQSKSQAVADAVAAAQALATTPASPADGKSIQRLSARHIPRQRVTQLPAVYANDGRRIGGARIVTNWEY